MWKMYKRTMDVAERLTGYVLYILVGFMVVVVFLQVIFRFILHASLPWSEEASRYIMIWIALLGASVGLRHKAHIGVEALFNYLGTAKRRLFSLLIGFVQVYFFCAMIFYACNILKVVIKQKSPAMEISMGLPYSSLIVGGGLMLLYSVEFLGNTIKDCRSLREEGKS